MATIIVTTTADSGAGSLREALATAQEGDTIKFASSLANQTITLTSGQLEVATNNLTIDGAGAANLKISGNKTSRVFTVHVQRDFTLKNLTITNGQTEGNGGAIRVSDYGNLTLVNCNLSNNTGARGGAIHIAYGGRANVLNSTFNNNDGTLPNGLGHSGGAISILGAGNLTVKGSRFTNNKGGNGGAIYSLLGGLTVENSVFLNNSAVGDMGGGAVFTDGGNPVGPDSPVGSTIVVRGSRFEGNTAIGEAGALFLYGYGADKVLVENSTVINNSATLNAKGISRAGGLRSNTELTIRNVTFANNSAEMQGGALWLEGDKPANIINSTFSGNKVAQDAGGAMFLGNKTSTPINIVNSTIVGNYAGRAAGAIWVPGSGTSVKLTNTIVANNTATDKGQMQVDFVLLDGGGNIEYPAPTVSWGKRVTAGSQIVDPLLGPLQNIGGSLVHVPQSGSPAINAGVKNSLVPLIDQGRVLRDALPDIGAYEVTSTRTAVQNSLTSVVQELSTQYGTLGNDTLIGTSGKDLLLSGFGNDVLIGGAGLDVLNGGAGKDKFVYTSFSDKGDIIIGFELAQDVIDLSALIDTAIAVTGNAFNDHVKLGQNGKDTIISLDLNADQVFREFITLKNVSSTNITAQHFVF